MKDKLQEIVRTGNKESLGRSNTLTFIFLLGYGANKIEKSQDELCADSGIDPRTIRSHLYALDKAEWIEYSGHTTNDVTKNIILKRFKH